MSTAREKALEEDAEADVLRRNYRLDKIASIIMGVVITFIFSQLWLIKDEFGKRSQDIELRQAEIRGQMSMLMGQMQTLIDKGSQTAQRTEVIVQQLAERMQKYDAFISQGRRFTADDGDKLEKRIERLEQSPPQKP